MIDEEEEIANEMISNNLENQDEATLELKNGGNNDIEMMINTANNNNQQKVAGVAAASVLFFIKRFTKYIDATSH